MEYINAKMQKKKKCETKKIGIAHHLDLKRSQETTARCSGADLHAAPMRHLSPRLRSLPCLLGGSAWGAWSEWRGRGPLGFGLVQFGWGDIQSGDVRTGFSRCR